MLILIPGMVMPLPAHGADADEIARLMQAFEALEAQNEAMAARLSALESQQATATAPAPAATSDQADGTADQEHLARRVTELEAARVDQEQVMRAVTTEKAALEQRVRELESDAAVERCDRYRDLYRRCPEPGLHQPRRLAGLARLSARLESLAGGRRRPGDLSRHELFREP